MIAARAVALLGPQTKTISFFNSATSTASTITLPGSISNGDLAILFDWAAGTVSIPPSVTPSGFTQIGTSQSESSGNSRWNMWRKTLNGSETTLTGMNGAALNNKVALVFRPTHGSWGSPASISTAVGVSGAPGQPFTVTVGSAPLIVLGAITNNVGTASLSMTPTQTATVTSASPGLQAGYIVYNSGPSNNSVTGTVTSDAIAVGCFYVPLS